METKKSKKTPIGRRGESPPPPHVSHCAAEGCMEEASYKAPKSPDNLYDYVWFCLEHVQEYNKKWNYFGNMGQEEIEYFMHDAVTGHRPTWKREEVAGGSWHAQLEAELERFLFGAYRRADTPGKHAATVNQKTRDALALLALESPASMQEIKKSYRELVKKFHPDLHAGSKSYEEKFKQITAAYHYLKTHHQE